MTPRVTPFEEGFLHLHAGPAFEHTQPYIFVECYKETDRISESLMCGDSSPVHKTCILAHNLSYFSGVKAVVKRKRDGGWGDLL